MNKTRRVEIPRLAKHPQYGKYIKRRTVCYVHDETNETRIGDTALAAEQFLALCSVRIFKRALFAVSAQAGPDEIAQEVEGALTMFFAAYGADSAHSSRKAAATRA